MSNDSIFISIIILCLFCFFSSIILFIVYIVLSKPTTTTTMTTVEDTKSNLVDYIFYCKSSINQCENYTITTGDLIHISNSSSTDYYFYIPYSLIVTFNVAVQSNKIVINSLSDLLYNFASIETEFQKQITNLNVTCDNLLPKIRNKSGVPYNTLAFFYDVSAIGATAILFRNTFLKSIPTSVQSQYLATLQQKIKNSNTLTLFEYVMYLAINNSNANYISLIK